jgi:hypothetical protein
MTATLIAAPGVPPLIGACLQSWCIASAGCYENEPGSLRYHKGRESSVRALGAAMIDVAPLQFDNQDNTPYSGPLVNIHLDGDEEIDLDFSVATGVAFAETLARFAGCEVPVGSEATFAGQHGPMEECGSITLRRIEDMTFGPVGSGADHMLTLAGIELTIHNPDCDPASFTVRTDGGEAATFARYVVAAAVEVAR